MPRIKSLTILTVSLRVVGNADRRLMHGPDRETGGSISPMSGSDAFPLRVLIVDDEPVAREVLREELETLPDIEVAGEADNEHAIRAFEAGAVDYLLKPVSRERLERSLDRARALRRRKGEAAESLVRLSELEEKFTAQRNRKVVGRS